MINITFEWHRRKSAENRKKHGVSFEEAKSAFLDENARLIPDPEHSDDDDRFVLLGLSSRLRLLVVVHCYQDNVDVIRIISARKADRSEHRQYSEFLR
ncbi:MAG: BrnT family toxin [Woeseiaceae bacterium]